MNRWRACIGLICAVGLDFFQQLFRILEPGLRAVGSCWCAGYPTAATPPMADKGRPGWPRTREALICWHAAAGLAEIGHLLDRELETEEQDLPNALRSSSTERKDDRP